MVNIRVSGSEFASIESAVNATKARSISDYVRAQVLEKVSEQSQIASRLARLEGIVGSETA